MCGTRCSTRLPQELLRRTSRPPAPAAPSRSSSQPHRSSAAEEQSRIGALKKGSQPPDLLYEPRHVLARGGNEVEIVNSGRNGPGPHSPAGEGDIHVGSLVVETARPDEVVAGKVVSTF